MDELEKTVIVKEFESEQLVKLALLEQLKEDMQLFGVEYTQALIEGYIRGIKFGLPG